MVTVCPVFAVLTVMKRRVRSTSFHLSRQQSPRRMAVHIPVTMIGRMKSSSLAVSRMAFSSSGVNGLRKTVSVSFVTML